MSAQKCVPVESELDLEPNTPPEDKGDGNDEIPELQKCSDNKVEGKDKGAHEGYERNKAMIATDCDVSRLFLLFATIVTYHV
jgi:hypothetical protein